MLLAAASASPVALAQAPNGAALQAEQRERLAPLAWLDGIWRGSAEFPGQIGPLTITQTERVGPMLDGTVKVIEGRGYDPDGKLVFNALTTLAWNRRPRLTRCMPSPTAGWGSIR
jgi:hypothetical protein